MCILFDNYFFSLFILTTITKTNTGGRLLYFEYKKTVVEIFSLY